MKVHVKCSWLLAAVLVSSGVVMIEAQEGHFGRISTGCVLALNSALKAYAAQRNAQNVDADMLAEVSGVTCGTRPDTFEIIMFPSAVVYDGEVQFSVRKSDYKVIRVGPATRW